MPAFRQIVSELRPQGRLNAGPAQKSLSLEPVAQGATAIVDEELQRRHQEALVNGRTALNELEARLIRDPEHGAMNRRGAEAFGIGKIVLEEVDRETSRIGDTMDDRTRPAFLAMAQARRAQIEEWANRHESHEREVVRGQNHGAAVLSSVERAAGLAAMPARDAEEARLNAVKVQAEIAAGRLTVANYWGGRASPEVVAAKEAEYVSAAHEGVIKNLQQRDPTAAMAYFKEHQKAISPLRWDEVGKTLTVADAMGKAQSFADDAVTKGMTLDAALTQAREKFPPGDPAREHALAQVKTRYGEVETVKAMNQKAADEEGRKIVVNGKSPAAIPADLWTRMSASAQEHVQTYAESRWRRAKADAEGKKHEETPEAHLQYLGALRMATERPAEFAAMSDEALAKYQPLLTPQHYQQLIAMRTGINKDQAKAVQLGKLRKEALALVGSALPDLKIKMEGAKRTPTEVARANAFDVALQDAILEAADKGPVDSKELRTITANLLRVGIEQGTGGWFSDPKKKLGFEIDAERASGVAKTYVVKPYDEIPPEQQRALVESLAKTKGLKRSIYGGDYVLTAEDKQEVERMYQRAVEAGRIKP